MSKFKFYSGLKSVFFFICHFFPNDQNEQETFGPKISIENTESIKINKFDSTQSKKSKRIIANIKYGRMSDKEIFRKQLQQEKKASISNRMNIISNKKDTNNRISRIDVPLSNFSLTQQCFEMF